MDWRVSVTAFLISLVLPSARSYLDKCYCCGVDPILTYDDVLRNKLHELRRDETDNWKVYALPVVPAAGVPPGYVLKHTLPSKDLPTLESYTPAQYAALKTSLKNAYEQRESDHNITLQSLAGRRRREVSAEEEAALARRMKKAAEEKPHVRRKRAAAVNSFYPMLLPEFKLYGVKPSGGELTAATTCVCDKKPTSLVRKVFSLHVAWDPSLKDPTSAKFRALKKEVDKKLDDLYTADAYMLQDGYAGSTMLSVNLQQMDAITVTTTTPAPSANGTNATEPEGPRDDLVKVEVEMAFSGLTGQPAPKRDLDRIFSSKESELGMTAENSQDGYCKGQHLQNLLAPSFLETTTPTDAVMPSGTYIKYTCVDTNRLLPSDNDPDSNFAIDILCNKGTLVRPTWPAQCLPAAWCTNPPAAPSGFTRADNRTKFRVNEKAYYSCTADEAVLDDKTGMNVFELNCDAHETWATTWPSCIVEPKCTSLQVPDQTATGLIKLTTPTEIKWGEKVVYECVNASNYQEMPTGPRLELTCYIPPGSSTPKIDYPSPWPVCTQLECKCLGKHGGLNIEQTRAAFSTALASKGNYDMYTDAGGNGYVIPKRINYGTFKPASATWESRCNCDDRLDPPMIIYNEMEIVNDEFIWNSQFGDATSSQFRSKKIAAENAMDKFYMSKPELYERGYLRSIVVQFSVGMLRPPNPNFPGDYYYSRAKVEQHFEKSSNLTIKMYQDLHKDLTTNVSGVIEAGVYVINPLVSISTIHTCLNETLSTYYRDEYKVTGVNVTRTVGEMVFVNCAKDHQFFSQDKWDSNSTDNTLSARCKPNKHFDVPASSLMPKCQAKCAGVKPLPDASFKLELDTSKSSATNEVWQGGKIYYKCKDRLDGLKIIGPDGVTPEGSTKADTFFTCDTNGHYAPWNGSTLFTECIPRPKRCVCLGNLETPEMATKALDLYCRNETLDKGKVMPSLDYDADGKEIPVFVPDKTRCGTLDPLDIDNMENKCKCYPKDDKGSDEGIWFHMEIINIPFFSDMADPNKGLFRQAKIIIEQVMDKVMINNKYLFSKGYVRTHVMKIAKGYSNLTKIHMDTVKLANENGTSNFSSIVDMESSLPGDPIINAFEFPKSKIDAMIKNGQAKAGIDGEWTSVVKMEVQFVQKDAIDLSTFLNLMKEYVANGWLNGTIWTVADCIGGLCTTGTVPRCNTNDLSSIFNFGFTHSNKVPAGAYPKNEIPVGGTINLFCEYSNERMTSDKFDDWHDDFQLTILCKPNEKFDIPIEGFPTCKSWCPAEKALPPPESGMSLAKDTDPKKEYWADEKIKYSCDDPSLGIDASDNNFIEYKCKGAEPTGKYETPGENDTWPVCMTRTTTVKPSIKLALKQVLLKFDENLISLKTREKYITDLNAGDEDLWLVVALPGCLGLMLLALILFCCTRVDNPLCKYCSNTYSPMTASLWKDTRTRGDDLECECPSTNKSRAAGADHS